PFHSRLLLRTNWLSLSIGVRVLGIPPGDGDLRGLSNFAAESRIELVQEENRLQVLGIGRDQAVRLVDATVAAGLQRLAQRLRETIAGHLAQRRRAFFGLSERDRAGSRVRGNRAFDCSRMLALAKIVAVAERGR